MVEGKGGGEGDRGTLCQLGEAHGYPYPATVMNSMGVRDAYLRKDEPVDAARPVGSRVGPAGDGGREALECDLLTRLGLPAQHHADLQNQATAQGELDGQVTRVPVLGMLYQFRTSMAGTDSTDLTPCPPEH